MRVWLAKFGRDEDEDFEVLLGVFYEKEKAITHALQEAYREGSPYIESEVSNDIYVRFDGQNDYYVVVDSWEVL